MSKEFSSLLPSYSATTHFAGEPSRDGASFKAARALLGQSGGLAADTGAADPQAPGDLGLRKRPLPQRHCVAVRRRSSICSCVRCAGRQTLPSIAHLLTRIDTALCYTTCVKIINEPASTVYEFDRQSSGLPEPGATALMPSKTANDTVVNPSDGNTLALQPLSEVTSRGCVA
jgi:hypothetical protein